MEASQQLNVKVCEFPITLLFWGFKVQAKEDGLSNYTGLWMDGWMDFFSETQFKKVSHRITNIDIQFILADGR